MKAITIRQPWASLIAASVKTIETRPRPTSYRGRVAVHAGRDEGHIGYGLGAYQTWTEPGDSRAWACHVSKPDTDKIVLPFGAVVGSAVLTDCVPICDSAPSDGRHIYVQPNNVALLLWTPGQTGLRMDDQLPFGDFTPGRWAWLLADAKPTTERCPWCWGEGKTERIHVFGPGWDGEQAYRCPLCNGDERSGPVPTRGHSGLWEWAP